MNAIYTPEDVGCGGFCGYCVCGGRTRDLVVEQQAFRRVIVQACHSGLGLLLQRVHRRSSAKKGGLGALRRHSPGLPRYHFPAVSLEPYIPVYISVLLALKGLETLLLYFKVNYASCSSQKSKTHGGEMADFSTDFSPPSHLFGDYSAPSLEP